IVDANSGQDLTLQTNTVIVGQQMNLRCQPTSTNFPATNFQWTVPGVAISNYVVAADASSAMVVTNFATNNAGVKYYWVNGASNRIVQCSAAVNGITVTAHAMFDVQKPPIRIAAIVMGQIRGDRDYYLNYLGATWPYLHFGGYSQNGNLVDGIDFHYDLSGTSYSASQFEFLRLGVAHRQCQTSGGTNNFVDSLGFDNRVTRNPEGDSPSQPAVLYDSNNNLIPLTMISANDIYVESLMFQYDANSIEVPLQSVTWNWSASAYANNNWQPASPQYPCLITNQSPVFPQWTNKLDVHHTTSTQP
ncbi:MAG: hypothetical protein P4N59_05725, partial [Negativicutes bacterium]|nr:hypothetical protein [Negativicutes bacterium]